MQTISSVCEGFFESRGSKFFSFLLPIIQFDQKLLELRQFHPKAVHFVHATRKKETQIIESFSDDGEPRGSSGVPTLNVLRGEDLIDVGVITVRYFGGTLLGVGGLVRAYTQSAQDAIKIAKEKDLFLPYEEMVVYSFVISYSSLKQVQYWIDRLEIIVLNKTFHSDGVEIELSSTQEKKRQLDDFYQAKFGLLPKPC